MPYYYVPPYTEILHYFTSWV